MSQAADIVEHNIGSSSFNYGELGQSGNFLRLLQFRELAMRSVTPTQQVHAPNAFPQLLQVSPSHRTALPISSRGE
jgi:hypothetical protein